MTKQEWRESVTLTMLQNGKEPYEIIEAIKKLEPLVFAEVATSVNVTPPNNPQDNP